MRTMLCSPVLTTSVSFGRFRFYLHKVLIQLCNCDITIIGYFRNQYAFPFHSYQNSVMYTFYKGLTYQNGVVALYCISKACSDISKQYETVKYPVYLLSLGFVSVFKLLIGAHWHLYQSGFKARTFLYAL